MSVKETDSDFLVSTIKPYGTNTYNYSVDMIRKAAFIDEINNVMVYFEKSVAKDIIVEYLKIRIEEITTRYK